jgi:alanyl-tRNA synthetase
MDTNEIITTFLEFFEDERHRRTRGSSLIPPPGDPVLFTTSGMHPLTPFLEGSRHPLGPRLVNIQRCLRTTDLDEVGDRTHLTVFQMLGTWSLGDYDGQQSLQWGHRLLCEGFGIDRSRLHVTVFGGDEQLGPDEESLRTWQQLGVPVELTHGENWWSNGPTGPCGPDSEIFVWTGSMPPEGSPTTDDRWVEVWNHVMMRYRRRDDGKLDPLRRPNIDTGMGLERLVTVLQGKQSVYDIDLFRPWRRTLPDLWDQPGRTQRIVTDHLRSSIVVIGDGVRPSNTGRGYVLRRLIRRTLTTLWREDRSRSLVDLPTGLLEHTLDHFEQSTPVGEIREVLLDEERRFGRLLDRGRRVLDNRRGNPPLTEEEFRYLHDTHGLPRDLVVGLLAEQQPG